MRFLVSGILLLLPVSAAAAPGINLSWSDCYSGLGHQNLNSSCSSDFGTPHRMVMTVAPDATIDQVAGATGIIELQFDAAVVPDYWKMHPGGPRDGALTLNVFGAPPNPAIAYPEPWSQVGSQVGGVSYAIGSSPDRAAITWSVTAPGGTVLDSNLSPEWALAALELSRTGSTTIAGCATAACLVFSEVTLWRSAGAPGGNLTICSPAQNQHITWQGGGTLSCPPGHGTRYPEPCPGATPARANTWGEIKQLYR